MFPMLHLRKALFAVLLCSLLCQAGEPPPGTAQILVRALDYKTGRPLKGNRIAIWLSDSAGQIQPDKSEKIIQSTSSDGGAIFHVKEPLPPKMTIDTDSLGDWNCAATWRVATSEILQRGIVGQHTPDAECREEKSPPATSATPGEVVIYVHQLGVLDRLYRLFY